MSNCMYIMLIGLLYQYMVASDSYRVQSDSNMVKSDLHGWLESKYGPKLICIKVVQRVS